MGDLPALDPATLGGRVLVIAPHPDDESLGCGGLIALLARRGADIRVDVVSDGAGSHNSASFPPARLAALRKDEVLSALGILGVKSSAVSFANLPDRYVPRPEMPGFAEAVGRAMEMLAIDPVDTLVFPGPGDAHGDHRAAGAIWRRAAEAVGPAPRILEYVVWENPEAPVPAHRVALDISSVLDLKRRAIEAHRSQRGLVVTDDPNAFALPETLLNRALQPREVYATP